MAFNWSSVGTPPLEDELEVAVFGPGYGECILVHVGHGKWIIVDSCIDSTDREDIRPVAEKYLRALHVEPATSVDLIVATHWHADHVRGIGKLVEICPNAKFSCANAMVREEFTVFLEEMATGSAATNGAKLADFRRALQVLHARQQVIRFATGGKSLRTWRTPDNVSEQCDVLALSPSDAEYELFMTRIGEMRPKHAQPKKAAAASTPNLVSVALHLKFPTTSVLLGADLESHHNPARGWSAAISEIQSRSRPQAALIKIPHHGSHTGHHSSIWTIAMQPGPLAVVTPFNKLPEAGKLPKQSDIERLKEQVSELYITGPQRLPSTRGREAAVDRSLKESSIQIRSAAAPLGLVRFRFQEISGWSKQVFAPAAKLHP